MKHYFTILMLGALPLAAAELDMSGVGRDLNGWNEDQLAWYGIDGLSFRASTPVLRSLEGGTLEITMKLEQVVKRVSVYTAEIRVVVTSDGLVRAAEISGEVDGAPFDTGEVTRPEMAVAAPDAVPVSAEAEMREQLSQSLDSAIVRARTSGKQARKDVTARFFGADAGESGTLTKATDVAVKSLFRRVHP
ncbi:hypothetical protein ACFQY0_19185 [Haloferula chungangensis]|uniref:Uncharacterized protein n=1 Tax=Haloferula chungangensis TaxID=1048331 RepID=A0ABW2LCJ2_9BACT